MAPGATRLMNACCPCVPGVVYWRPEDEEDDAEGVGAGAGAGDAGLALAEDAGRAVPGLAIAPGMATAPVPSTVAGRPGILAAESARVGAPPPVAPWPSRAPVARTPGIVAPPARVPVPDVSVPGCGDCGAGFAAPGFSSVAGAGFCCAADAGEPMAPGVGVRFPLSTNPTTPWLASGALDECAFTVRSGSESAPIVSSTPSAYLVTTSMWPL